MTSVAAVSLEELFSLGRQHGGAKRYRIGSTDSGSFRGDFVLNAVVDTGGVLYFHEQDLWSYRYEKSENVSFDEDKHPHWVASFDGDSFRLYDGIFLGRYGCGGYDRYIATIRRARRDLARIPDYDEVMQRYQAFSKAYPRVRDSFTGNAIRAQFGLATPVRAEELGNLSSYLRYEEDGFWRDDRELLIFWQWFKNNFVNETAYIGKIERITKPEHRRVYDEFVARFRERLEDEGFLETRK